MNKWIEKRPNKWINKQINKIKKKVAKLVCTQSATLFTRYFEP